LHVGAFIHAHRVTKWVRLHEDGWGVFSGDGDEIGVDGG
jgi:hypothetical protein